jgi:hypothetical protein
VSLILVQRDRVSDLLRLGIDFDIDSRIPQHRKRLAIESGYRFRRERDGSLVAAGCPKCELMVYEIKLQLERSSAVGNRRGRQAARVDV